MAEHLAPRRSRRCHRPGIRSSATGRRTPAGRGKGAGMTITKLPTGSELAAPKGWLVNRSLAGTPDERLILIRAVGVDARYELHRVGAGLRVEATRWRGNGRVDWGCFRFDGDRLLFVAGRSSALAHADLAPVTAV